MVRDDQFTLRSLLVATAFIAVACAVLKLIIATGTRQTQTVGFIVTPIFACAAIGALRGSIVIWIARGAAIAFFVALFIWILAIGGDYR